MIKNIFTSYLAFLALIFLGMALLMAGATMVHASEVTGNLSSDASSNTQTTGSINGTVISESGGSSGSSGGSSSRSGGSRDSSSNTPTGSVLGASTDNPITPTLQTPSFPNAGFNPVEESARMTPLSIIVSFVSNLFSF